MHGLLLKVASIIASGIIFRLLASIGFGLGTASFIDDLIERYLQRSIHELGTALNPDIAAYLNLLRADDCLNAIFGTIAFIASYKSLKLIFVRKL